MSDMSEHRVPMLGASWRRYEDPERSRDPRVRAVVSALSSLPAAAPDPDFRAELRAQLVAITPRIVAESRPDDPSIDLAPRRTPHRAPTPARRPRPHPLPRGGRAVPAAAGPQHADGFLGRLSGIRIGRPLTILACLLVAAVLLFGGAVWMSRGALPGESLYGLKRASERVQLATAGNDSEKAQDYLNFATTRANEVKDLLARASTGAAGTGAHAGGVSSGTAKLITSTLASADSDVRSAARILGNQAIRSASTAPLSRMTHWAPDQLSRLNAIAAALPAGATHEHARDSAALVTRALDRAKTLGAGLDCGCRGSAGSDDLGPKPCASCARPPANPARSGQHPATPGQSSQPGQHANTKSTPAGSKPTSSHGATGTNGNNSRGDSGRQASQPRSATSTSAASTPSDASTPSGAVLNPPPASSSQPVTTNRCGLGATLGPISIGLGVCPVHVGVSLP